MFSSNQIFDISCGLRDLPRVVDFGVRLSGWHEPFTRQIQRLKMAYQITKTGVYCIGLGSMPRLPPDDKHPAGRDGIAPDPAWTDYPFDYDPDIVAQIIAQWIKSQPEPARSDIDGAEHTGARVTSWSSIIDEGHDSMAIKVPLSCILTFRPVNLEFYK